MHADGVGVGSETAVGVREPSIRLRHLPVAGDVADDDADARDPAADQNSEWASADEDADENSETGKVANGHAYTDPDHHSYYHPDGDPD